MKRFTSYYPLISFPLLLTFFLPNLPSTLTVLYVLVCDSRLIRFAYRNTGEGFYRSIANLPGSTTLREMSLPSPAVIDCLWTLRRGGASWDTPFRDWTVQSQCGCGSCTDIHSSYVFLSTTGMSYLEGSAPEYSTFSILLSTSVEF